MKKKDLVAVAVISFIWAVLTIVLNLTQTYWGFVGVLFVTGLFACLVAFLVKKIGSVLLFFCLGGIFSIGFDNLGLGYWKLLVLPLMGVVFELAYFGLRMEFKNLAVDGLIAAALSNGALPFLMMLLIKGGNRDILSYAINFSIIAALSGICGAVVMSILWYYIKSTEFVVKFQYSS
ncbi:MAG: hypothetical protein KJ601_03825 [Nanoarchaeota archaeon]|nr:hypothetical protein [Nanoarchaeota archaeon]MBU1704147.1 hypothetical protein [Nanoarchaeota archaeon]